MVETEQIPEDFEYDYDWLVVGSGFGGSVSALRLTEKGYRVGVIEAGQRFEDEDFAKSTWNFRRYMFIPKLGMRGILRIWIFKDVAILAGAGVGGGSLVYANTLYVPPVDFFRLRCLERDAGLGGGAGASLQEAKRMLGAVDVPFETDADHLFRELAEDLGVSDSYARPTVGVFFGEPGETVPDPFFGGEGPDRAGCIRCGACMVGCRHNAKNTLLKNYLYFAEKRGAEIIPDRKVVDIRPLGAEDGSDGYEISHRRSGAWVRRKRNTITARGVVISAGAVGSNILLRSCKDVGGLPRLSDRIGEVVRTNSEALLAVTARKDEHDFHNSVAITSSIYPDDVTHIENVTYGPAGDAMGLLFTMLTEGGTRLTRPLKLGSGTSSAPDPGDAPALEARLGEKTIILLVMQTVNNRPAAEAGAGRPQQMMLQTEQDPDNPNPTWIPVANAAAERLAEKMDGIAQSNLPEAILNTPATAHILGGALIGADRDARASSTCGNAPSATRTCSSATAPWFPPTRASTPA